MSNGRPRPHYQDRRLRACIDTHDGEFPTTIEVQRDSYDDPEKIRKLSSWLLNAAKWLELKQQRENGDD